MIDHITRHQLEHDIAVAAERWAETVEDIPNWWPGEHELRLLTKIDALRNTRAVWYVPE